MFMNSTTRYMPTVYFSYVDTDLPAWPLRHAPLATGPSAQQAIQPSAQQATQHSL